MKSKSPLLLLAAGFAAGLVVSALAAREKAPAAAPAPLVEPLGGVFNGRKLKPISVRVGDDIRRVGGAEPFEGEAILVYCEVNGTWCMFTLGQE